MKFKVRQGFVLKRVDLVDMPGQPGRKQERETIAYEGEAVDLSPEQAAQHLHQLEPADKPAQAFHDSRVLVAPAAVADAGAGAVPADVAREIAAKAVADYVAAQQAAKTAAA